MLRRILDFPLEITAAKAGEISVKIEAHGEDGERILNGL